MFSSITFDHEICQTHEKSLLKYLIQSFQITICMALGVFTEIHSIDLKMAIYEGMCMDYGFRAANSEFRGRPIDARPRGPGVFLRVPHASREALRP